MDEKQAGLDKGQTYRCNLCDGQYEVNCVEREDMKQVPGSKGSSGLGLFNFSWMMARTMQGICVTLMNIASMKRVYLSRARPKVSTWRHHVK